MKTQKIRSQKSREKNRNKLELCDYCGIEFRSDYIKLHKQRKHIKKWISFIDNNFIKNFIPILVQGG